MANKFSNSVNTHEYPKIFHRFLFLLRLQHFVTNILTLRTWYIKKLLSKLFCSFEKPFRFVDAGFGTGDMIFPYVSSFADSHFIGIDIEKNNVDFCNNYARKKQINNVEFIQSDLLDFKIEKKADVILCVGVMHYIKNDIKVFRNYYDNLNQGGSLVLYSPVNYKRIIPGYNKLINKYFKDIDYDTCNQICRQYTPGEIREKLQIAGFKIKSETFTYGFFGKIAHEIYSICLYVLGKYHWSFGILSILMLTMFLPFILLLMTVDFFKKHKTGNGLLIVAEKENTIKS